MFHSGKLKEPRLREYRLREREKIKPFFWCLWLTILFHFLAVLCLTFPNLCRIPPELEGLNKTSSLNNFILLWFLMKKFLLLGVSHPIPLPDFELLLFVPVYSGPIHTSAVAHFWFVTCLSSFTRHHWEVNLWFCKTWFWYIADSKH